MLETGLTPTCYGVGAVNVWCVWLAYDKHRLKMATGCNVRFWKRGLVVGWSNNMGVGISGIMECLARSVA